MEYGTQLTLHVLPTCTIVPQSCKFANIFEMQTGLADLSETVSRNEQLRKSTLWACKQMRPSCVGASNWLPGWEVEKT